MLYKIKINVLEYIHVIIILSYWISIQTCMTCKEIWISIFATTMRIITKTTNQLETNIIGNQRNCSIRCDYIIHFIYAKVIDGWVVSTPTFTRAVGPFDVAETDQPEIARAKSLRILIDFLLTYFIQKVDKMQSYR